MITAPPRPPGDLLRAEARRGIEHHHQWDCPAAFGILHWQRKPAPGYPAGTLTQTLWITISADSDGQPIHSRYWGHIMTGLTDQQLRQRPGDPPCAFVLAVEVWTGPQPPPEPAAAETAMVFVADFRGRVWQAEHTRAEPQVITERYYEPGCEPYWPELMTLTDLAIAVGITAWGVPMIIPAPTR
jgi:hypothetical protein